MLCECSWYVLNVFSGLAYDGFEAKKVSEIDQESVQSHSVLDMSARPVSRAGIQE